MSRILGLALAFLFACASPGLAEDLVVFHAGSLARPMADIAKAFQAETGLSVKLVGSASGALRQRIEAGERPDLFASADMENPRKLAAGNLAQAPVPFTRNVQCLIARKSLHVTPANLVDIMLDPAVKLATSTPVLDPGGDYAWQVLDRIDALRPGAGAQLKAKARKLTGDPTLPAPPKDYPKYVVSWHFEQGNADLFLYYLTSARIVAQEVDAVEIVPLPANLAVGAEYGLAQVTGAKPAAGQLKDFILGPKGQSILRGYGFAEP